MIIIKKVEEQITDHLTKYHPKVTKKYLSFYLKFYAEEVLCNLYNTNRRLNYNYYLKGIDNCPVALRDDDIFLDNVHQEYPRVAGKYFNSDSKRIRLYFQIKRDFMELGILLMTYNKWMINDQESITSTKVIYHVVLPEDLTCYVSNTGTVNDQDVLRESIEDLSFGLDSGSVPESFTDVIPYTISDNDFWDTSYTIRGEDVVKLQSTLTKTNFIKIYSQFSRIQKSGFKILNDQRANNTGYRVFHTFSFLSIPLRNLIRDTKSGVKFKNMDLVSSHLYWLAIHTKNEQLYKDVANKSIKKMFDKQRLIMWLNSKNYHKPFYKKINDYFKSIDIDTSHIRGEKGLYDILAKLEGDYVVGKISGEFNCPNFTLHDQIYYLPQHEEVLLDLIRTHDNHYEFLPVWDSK